MPKLKFLTPPPLTCSLGETAVVIDLKWCENGGHFGYVSLHFKAKDGREGDFVFSGIYGEPEALRTAWDAGFEPPTIGPTLAAQKKLVELNLAAWVSDPSKLT